MSDITFHGVTRTRLVKCERVERHADSILDSPYFIKVIEITSVRPGGAVVYDTLTFFSKDDDECQVTEFGVEAE